MTGKAANEGGQRPCGMQRTRPKLDNVCTENPGLPAVTTSRPQPLRPPVATVTICPTEEGGVRTGSRERAWEDRGWVHANVPNRRGGSCIWGRRQGQCSGPLGHAARAHRHTSSLGPSRTPTGTPTAWCGTRCSWNRRVERAKSNLKNYQVCIFPTPVLNTILHVVSNTMLCNEE